MKHVVISAIALSMAATAGVASAHPSDHHRNDWHHHSHGWHSHGWREHSDWRRGERVGWGDWRRGRIVDYRAHHLHRPPRGYEWREVDGRYVLAAVASGIIADIILNSH